MRRLAVAAIMIASASGCAPFDDELVRNKYRAYLANSPDVDPVDVEKFAGDYDNVLGDFARVAGVTLPAANGEWRPVIDAGINYVDTRISGSFTVSTRPPAPALSPATRASNNSTGARTSGCARARRGAAARRSPAAQWRAGTAVKQHRRNLHDPHSPA